MSHCLNFVHCLWPCTMHRPRPCVFFPGSLEDICMHPCLLDGLGLLLQLCPFVCRHLLFLQAGFQWNDPRGWPPLTCLLLLVEPMASTHLCLQGWAPVRPHPTGEDTPSRSHPQILLLRSSSLLAAP